MSNGPVFVILNFLWMGGLIGLAILAQRWRIQRDELVEYANLQNQWIDEIIEALENADEDAGNESIDGLLDRASGWGRGVRAGSGRGSGNALRDRD